MNYCEKCQTLTENTHCPNCGNPGLREIRPDDFIFLTTLDEFYGRMYEGALQSQNIETVSRGLYSNGGLIWGKSVDTDLKMIFVRYADLDAAKEIYKELFTPKDDEA